MEISSLSALDQVIDLRRALNGEVETLAQKRAALQAQLDAQLEALGKKLKEVDVELEAKRRTLKLVWATEQQLAGQGQPGLPEGGPVNVPGEAGIEVRQWVRQSSRDGITHVDPCCGSPRQRLPSSGPDHRRPMRSRRLSPSPRGPSPCPCGRTTCCRC
jgi:hypothetical protein